MFDFYYFLTASRHFGTNTAILAFVVLVAMKITERLIKTGNRKGIAVTGFAFAFLLCTVLSFVSKRETDLLTLLKEAVVTVGVALFLSDVTLITERTAPPDKTAKMNHTSDPSGKGNKPKLSEQKIVKVLLRLFSFVSSCLRIRNGNRKKKDPSSGRDETQIARKDDQN